jgi:hypothetical protein
MSVGNQLIPGQSVSGNQYLSAPFQSVVPITGFQNKQLASPASGTYSVYAVLLPKTSPSTHIKLYILELNITSLGSGQNSPLNPLPSPYISSLGELFPNGFTNSSNVVNVGVFNAGQTFTVQNTSGPALSNFKCSLIIIGI